MLDGTQAKDYFVRKERIISFPSTKMAEDFRDRANGLNMPARLYGSADRAVLVAVRNPSEWREVDKIAAQVRPTPKRKHRSRSRAG